MLYRFLILLSLCATSHAGTQSGTFQRLTSPAGATLCITDTPDGVTCLRDDSETACGIRCLVQPGCEAYNVQQTADCTHCQVYNHWPNNISRLAGCTGYVSHPKRGELYQISLFLVTALIRPNHSPPLAS